MKIQSDMIKSLIAIGAALVGFGALVAVVEGNHTNSYLAPHYEDPTSSEVHQSATEDPDPLGHAKLLAWSRASEVMRSLGSPIPDKWSPAQIPVTVLDYMFLEDSPHFQVEGRRLGELLSHIFLSMEDGHVKIDNSITLYISENELCLAEDILTHEYLHYFHDRLALVSPKFKKEYPDSEKFAEKFQGFKRAQCR